MNFSPQILFGCLLYFGALIIPTLYFLSNREHGTAKKPMLIGVGLQIFASIMVAALAYFSWRSGYQDAWMAWGLLVPINFISFLYFLMVLFTYGKKNKK
jgi:drug/metabolite transporter (DMT)-like permease